MLGAFARASVILDDEKYRAAAEKNLQFIRRKLVGRKIQNAFPPLARWRTRPACNCSKPTPFFLSGVIDLYEATLEPKHLDFAIELAEAMLAKFYDPENGGFWQSAADSKDLILRVKDDYDGAEPSRQFRRHARAAETRRHHRPR